MNKRIKRLAQKHFATMSHYIDAFDVLKNYSGPRKAKQHAINSIAGKLGVLLAQRGDVKVTVDEEFTTEFNLSIYWFSPEELEKFVADVIATITEDN